MHAFFVATFLIRKTVLCTLCHAYQTMKPFFNRYVFPHTSALVSAATLCHSQTCTIKKCKKLNTFNKTTTNYNICTRKSTRSHRHLLPTTNAMFAYTPHTHTHTHKTVSVTAGWLTTTLPCTRAYVKLHLNCCTFSRIANLLRTFLAISWRGFSHLSSSLIAISEWISFIYALAYNNQIIRSSQLCKITC